MSRQIDDMLFSVHSKDEFDTAVNELKLHMDIEGEKNWLCIIMVLKLNRDCLMMPPSPILHSSFE